jgi:hypothetical protein
MNKSNKIFALTLLTSLLILAALNVSVLSVNAQGQATVIVVDSVGGSTDPAAGTTTPADGTSVTFTATPDATDQFSNWIIVTSTGSTTSTDNPFALTVSGGVTYTVQAVFSPVQAPPGGTLPTTLATAAIVVVLTSAGGTTSPAPGVYALANAASLSLTATATTGWQFSHWVISGPNLSHGGYPYTATPTDNPYNVNHGYGNRYSYQAVFTPVGSTEPTPTGGATATPGVGGLSSDMWIIIGLVVVIIILLIAFGVFATRRKK